MNDTQKMECWAIVSLLSILMIELLLDNILVVNKGAELMCNESLSGPKNITLLFFLILLGVSICINGKYIWVKKNNEENQLKKEHKIKDILKTLIKNTVSGNALDLLFVLFFLLHLTWIPDAIFESVKDDLELNNIWLQILHPAIYIIGLFLVILLKPQIKKNEQPDPKVIFTGISFISFMNITPFLEPIKEREIDKLIVFVDKRIKVIKLEGLETKKSYVELQALYFISQVETFIARLRKAIPGFDEFKSTSKDLCLTLAVYEEEIIASNNIDSIKNIIEKLTQDLKTLYKQLGSENKKKLESLFPDFIMINNDQQDINLICKPLNYLQEKLAEDGYANVGLFPYQDSLRIWIIKTFVKELVANCTTEARVEIKVCDYDDIPSTYQTISLSVADILQQGYVDNNLLFNITPGTANISVALALNSIKGNRICGYKEQNGRIQKDGKTKQQFREVNLSVYDLKEVFAEIID